MFRNRYYHIILLITGCILISCNQDNDGIWGEQAQDATLRLEIIGHVKAPAQKAAPRLRSFSESAVGDLYVAVYNNRGELTGKAYGTGNSINVATRSGTGCTIYALVNSGNGSLSIPTSRTALQQMTTQNLTAIDDIMVNEHLIMSGNLPIDISAGENSPAPLTVSRLAAKIKLTISCGEGTILTGYAVRNLPVRSWFVSRPNSAESSDTDEAIGDDAVDTETTGDWLDTPTLAATQTDANTYTTTFYQYENRRGGRITLGGTTGDVTSQTQKANYAPDRATYIELYVDANGTSTTHRLYLGANTYTNYNIKRNCSYTYNLSISNTGMGISSISIKEWTPIMGEDIELH